jgi:hypothetical protein
MTVLKKKSSFIFVLFCLGIIVVGLLPNIISKIKSNRTREEIGRLQENINRLKEEVNQIALDKQQNLGAVSDAFCKHRQGEYISGYFICPCIDLKTTITYMKLSKGESTTISNAKSSAVKADCDEVASLCLDWWDSKECLAIAEQKLWIGMTATQLEISMGLPKDKNNTVGSWGMHSQWVYSDSVYVYLEGTKESDMVVTSWQD